MKSDYLLWLFPIVFMIHEFEEIVFMKWWIRKNSESILLKFPRLGERIIQQQKSLSTEQFTLIVAEEFIIVFLIIIISALTSNYNLYLGLVFAYSIHLLVHIIQSIVIWQYTPAIVTSIITGLFCIYVFYYFINNDLIDFTKTIIYSLGLTLFVFINLRVMHFLAKKIKTLS
jgi:hypothetical protein